MYLEVCVLLMGFYFVNLPGSLELWYFWLHFSMVCVFDKRNWLNSGWAGIEEQRSDYIVVWSCSLFGITALDVHVSFFWWHNSKNKRALNVLWVFYEWGVGSLSKQESFSVACRFVLLLTLLLERVTVPHLNPVWFLPGLWAHLSGSLFNLTTR